MSKVNDFKKGQKVIGKENVDSEVEKGKVYTISKVEGDFVHCEELEYGHFCFYFKHSTDEMFKELNYKKYESEKCIQYIKDGIDRIEFYLDSKTIKCYIWNDGYKPLIKSLDVRELQAINEKVKELNWQC